MAKSTDSDADILKEAKARFERCVAWESTARANALADSRFANGDSINLGQWDQSVRNARGDRPCLTMNKTRQHILQIVNDARQHKAAIKVTPTGSHATFEAAQIFSGIIRRIEYQSKAIDAYSTAIFHQVETGIGYVRVVTDYADEDSFDQEIFIRRIADPKTIYLDPDSREYDKADMKFAFVFNDIARDTYDAAHGEGDMPSPAALDYTDGWNDRDHVREAEYWRCGEKDDTLHLMDDGTQLRESEMPAGGKALIKGRIVKSRKVSEPEVEWFKIVGDRIDERKSWPGRYIPIVPFIGEEIVIENQMDRKGHTRALIDAQRMYNYWTSMAAEQVAAQSKSPWIAPARAIEGYETFWDTANVKNHAYLPYNDMDDSSQPIQRPERNDPPQMAQAFIQGMNIAKEDMMMVSGQYQAMMGQQGNEVSGTAISQRQRQGDNAVYHYIDNQAKGIRQIGRIVLDLIPKVYDVARVMKIMGEDGTDSDVAMVPNAPQAHQHVVMGPNGAPQPVSPEQAGAIQADPNQPDPKVIFNPNVGRYDVEADVGPSYGTKREEAFNAFSQIMSQNHEAFAIVGDFWAANADFPGADELADRLKRGLPPQYQGVNPQVSQLQQQMQQMQGKFHELMSGAQNKVIQLEHQLRDKGDEHEIKDYDAETRRLAALGAVDPMLVQMIARQLWENMQQTSLGPAMQSHAQLEQSLQPPDPSQQPPPPEQPEQPPPPDPLAVQQQGHQQMMDRAKLGLAAQAQAHSQQMAVAQHGLAVKQAQQPTAGP